jgi:hypothetical protein
MRTLIAALLLLAAVPTPAEEGMSLYFVTPCRFFDTRAEECVSKPCSMGAHPDDTTRYYAARQGVCAGSTVRPIPADAKGVLLGVTAVAASGHGHLVLHDSTAARPGVASLVFSAGDPATGTTTFVQLGDVPAKVADLALYARVANGGTVHVTVDFLGFVR